MPKYIIETTDNFGQKGWLHFNWSNMYQFSCPPCRKAAVQFDSKKDAETVVEALTNSGLANAQRQKWYGMVASWKVVEA